MRTRINAVAALSLCALAGTAFAGPLNPPAGAVASSMKTLGEVEPRVALSAANTPGDADSVFKITQPGSYYLTGNLQGVAGRHGIEVTAANVTIDLNGFSVSGVAGSLTGVMVTAAGASDLTLVNGSVRGWGQSGVDTVTLNAERCTVKDLKFVDNGGSGVRLYRYGRAVNCESSGNNGYGFDAYSYCTLTGCGASGNGSNGIDAATVSLVSGCVSTGNSGAGIRAGTGSTVTGCVSGQNHMSGITVNAHCLVMGNNCSANAGDTDSSGILMTGADNRVEGNVCSDNSKGLIATSTGNVIVRNTCAGNTVNWSIAANNVFGPIVDRSGVVSPPVNGNTAGSTLMTTDPNANFSH